MPLTTASREKDSEARAVSAVVTIGVDARAEFKTFSTEAGTAVKAAQAAMAALNVNDPLAGAGLELMETLLSRAPLR